MTQNQGGSVNRTQYDDFMNRFLDMPVELISSICDAFSRCQPSVFAYGFGAVGPCSKGQSLEHLARVQ